jgi:putative hydrolase of the HAD superfamily
MPPIRALCLDLDGTLLDNEASVDASIERAAAGLALAYRASDFSGLAAVYRQVNAAFFASSVWAAVLRGEISAEASRLERWRLALARCGCDDNSIAQAALQTYSRHHQETSILFADTPPLLGALPAGLRLAIVTNGPRLTQREKLRAAGLESAVHAVVISGELGFAKPDAAIFRHALDALNVAPHEAVHVGDSLHDDVAGANAAGMTSVWLNRRGAVRGVEEPEPDHETRSLEELPRIVC